MDATLAEILPSVAARLGADGFDDTLDLAAEVGDAQRFVVMLVDGLGYHLLGRAAEYAPWLAARSETARLLRSPFPSTTPTSLVSLGTGVTPGEHGVLGFTVRVPGTHRVLTHIAWRDNPDPQQWQPIPTVYDRLGIPASVVLPAMFAHSGLTQAAYRGARFLGLEAGADPVAGIHAELARGARLVYSYTADLDTAAHLFGIASEQWATAAASIDGLLRRIADSLPDDTALLVTADHGGLDVPLDGRVDVAADARLTDGVEVIAGEPRVRYVHTIDGAVADVLQSWQGILGDRAEVLLRDDAVRRGLFGPVAPGHEQRIGDVVVICRGTTVILASDREPPEVSRLVGFHGALTSEETDVPLILQRSAR